MKFRFQVLFEGYIEARDQKRANTILYRVFHPRKDSRIDAFTEVYAAYPDEPEEDWTRRGKAWRIDNDGVVHWPGKPGKTYCRRPSGEMQKSWDPTLFLTCEACKDLNRYQKDDPWATPTTPS